MQTSAGTAIEPQAAAAAMFRNRLSVRMMVARDYWGRGCISRVAGAAKVRMGDDDKVDGEVGRQFASRWCHAL